MHQQRLTLMQKLVYHRARAVVFGATVRNTDINIRHVQETGFVQADIDEGSFHSRQHPVYLSLVDVADDSPAGLALNTDFLQSAIFHDRNAGLPGRNVD